MILVKNLELPSSVISTFKSSSSQINNYDVIFTASGYKTGSNKECNGYIINTLDFYNKKNYRLIFIFGNYLIN